MTGAELIKQFLEGVKSDAVSDLHSKNISQGDLDMAVTIQGDGASVNAAGSLTGAEYWYYLVHGRKPGKQPPIESIQGWLQKKGIVPVDIPQRSLAFLIARKIGKLGTDIYQGKRPGLALPAIIEARTQGFEEDLDQLLTGKIDTTITDQLNQLFNNPN